jgi:hypothetical protein
MHPSQMLMCVGCCRSKSELNGTGLCTPASDIAGDIPGLDETGFAAVEIEEQKVVAREEEIPILGNQTSGVETFCTEAVD